MPLDSRIGAEEPDTVALESNARTSLADALQRHFKSGGYLPR